MGRLQVTKGKRIKFFYPPPVCRATLYTYHFETEMMIFRQANGLKGQFILAQGKRSVALGWKMDVKIVRAITFFERLSLLRTKRYVCQFPTSGRQASERRFLP